MAANTTPGPVVNAAAVASFISAAVLVLTFLGFKSFADALSAQTTTIVAIVLGLVTTVPALLAAVHARGKVTPVIDARDANGVPLITAVSPTAVTNPLTVQPAAIPAPAELVDGDGVNDELPDQLDDPLAVTG